MLATRYSGGLVWRIDNFTFRAEFKKFTTREPFPIEFRCVCYLVYVFAMRMQSEEPPIRRSIDTEDPHS